MTQLGTNEPPLIIEHNLITMNDGRVVDVHAMTFGKWRISLEDYSDHW